MEATRPKIFVSVGNTFTNRQKEFVDELFKHLELVGVEPHEMSRTEFPFKSPLLHIEELMRECSGTVVIAFERLYFPNGLEMRGGREPRSLSDTKITTTWNHVEAAMAYMLGHPLLVVLERGCRQEGLVDQGHGWYLHSLAISPESLDAPQFKGALQRWSEEVKSRARSRAASRGPEEVAGLTILDLARRIKPAHVGVLVTITLGWAALVATVVANLQ